MSPRMPRCGRKGVIYLEGALRASREALIPAGDGPWEMRLRFEAAGAALVAEPPPGAEAADVTVTLDGAPVPATLRGADLQARPGGETAVALDGPRLYRLVAKAPAGKHEIVLTPSRPGTGFYVFYFDGCEPAE